MMYVSKLLTMYYLIDINNVVGNDKNAKGEAIKQKFRAYNSMDDYAKDKVQFLKKLYDFDENDDIATFTSKLTGANKGKRRYAEAKNYNTLLTNVYNKIAKGQEGLKINWKPDRPSVDVAKTVKEYGPSFASMILTGNPSSFINKILEGKKPSLDYTHKFGSTDNKFQGFASVMTPIFKEALEKNGFPLTNLNNIVRQAALESSYGLDPRGERGFNLGGIKHPGDSIAPKYKKTKHTDGEYYIDFDNLGDYASYKVKLLNDRYNALDARNTNDFIDRLHGNNPNKSNYSADKKSYLRNLNGTKSLDKFLRRGGVIKYQEPAQGIQRRDNTYVQPPIDKAPIIRTDESGKPWNELSTIERASLNVRQGRNPITSKPTSRGNLDIVSPEFDVLAGIKGVTSLFVNKPKPLIFNRTSKLTNAERRGIPKGDRKSPSPYREIGIVNEVSEKSMDITGDIFGSPITKKSEQAVFNHATDPSKVVKVYAVNNEGFPNIEAIKKFQSSFMKRNQIPFTVKNKFVGYVREDKGIFPVYVQNKITPMRDMSNELYEQKVLPKLIEQLKAKGYTQTSPDVFSNGKFKVTDLLPENMGYDSEGNLIFFDPKVYRLGGLLGRRHRYHA